MEELSWRTGHTTLSWSFFLACLFLYPFFLRDGTSYRGQYVSVSVLRYRHTTPLLIHQFVTHSSYRQSASWLTSHKRIWFHCSQTISNTNHFKKFPITSQNISLDNPGTATQPPIQIPFSRVKLLFKSHFVSVRILILDTLETALY